MSLFWASDFHAVLPSGFLLHFTLVPVIPLNTYEIRYFRLSFILFIVSQFPSFFFPPSSLKKLSIIFLCHLLHILFPIIFETFAHITTIILLET